MKKGIHPEYNEINVECITCNKKFKLKSTIKEFNIDVCSNCHPFYKGATTSVKSTGRVERFKRMFGETENKNKK